MFSTTNVVGEMCVELIKQFDIRPDQINLTPAFLSLRLEQPGTITLDEVALILNFCNEVVAAQRRDGNWSGKQFFLLLRSSNDG